MTNRAEELITQLEVEIVKRDARIAELEAQAGDGTSGNKYRAELYDEVWQAARGMGYGNVVGALQELAALKARQPSGVAQWSLVTDDAAEYGPSIRIQSWKPHKKLGYWVARLVIDKDTDLMVTGPSSRAAILAVMDMFVSGEHVDPEQASAGVVSVAQHDANKYCLILSALGMEEEGDPVAEVKRLQSLNPCRAQSVPDGYVLVPVEPTEAMRDAGNVWTLNRSTLMRAWDAMLAAAPPASAAAVSVPKLLGWAVDRWQAEVSQRPLVNAHRRILDDTWRQVIRKLGGDPVDLCGPAHDTLLSTTNRGEPQ